MKFEKERTARNLRAIRELKNYTRVQLAERSGVPKDSIISYENAKSIMSLEAAAKLANALECSVDSLVLEIKV